VRERLTGLKPPANAKALVDSWRKDIERDAGKALDRLTEVQHDQHAFSMLMRDVLSDLGIGDEFGTEDERNDPTSDQDKPPPPQPDSSDGQDDQEEESAADVEMLDGDVDMDSDRTISIERHRGHDRVRRGRAGREADTAQGAQRAGRSQRQLQGLHPRL
jgi:cobaltochelatase CobT